MLPLYTQNPLREEKVRGYLTLRTPLYAEDIALRVEKHL